MANPVKTTANEWVVQHGPQGWLIRRLQRYALLGWLLFAVMLALFVGEVALVTLRPVPVLAVDRAGRVLGRFEYLDASTRSSAEILAASQDFLTHYLSLNSGTIYNDYALALNLLAAPLEKTQLASIQKDGYLARVQKAETSSYLTFARGPQAPQILSRSGLHSVVRLRGQIVFTSLQTPDQAPRTQPFDVTLTLTTVPRTRFNTQGLEIDAIAER